MTMYKRLAKEFRQLLLPLCVAAGAACTMQMFAMLGGPWEAGPSSFFYNLSTFAFFGGIGVAAGMAFGAEFQQRTLGLLVSQPVSRSRIWKEKMLVLLFAVTAAGLILWLSEKFAYLIAIHWPTSFAGLRSISGDLVSGICVVAMVCSAGFWTLFARSTIGGIVFSVASVFFVALGVLFALNKLYGPEVPIEGPIVTGSIVGAGILYSTIFLWLGWRKFARLEIRDVSFGDSGFESGPLAGTRRWAAWLRCRPAGMTLNLIRKELRLQKPLFLVAAILSLCWLVTLLLLLLDPARMKTFETILNLLTAIYVVVLPLLAGCISLGEEKALGLTAWHLTLPVSTRRQWLLKLAVSMSVAILLGFALPWLLAWLSAVKTKVGLSYLMNENNDGWLMFLAAWELTFLMSFWAVTMLTNTLRAALGSMIGLALLCFCGALGLRFEELVGPLQTELLRLPAAYFHLPPDFFFVLAIKCIVPLMLVTVVVAILAQSLAQFRRVQTPVKIIWKYSVILAVVVFLMAFWLADLGNSASALNAPLLK